LDQQPWFAVFTTGITTLNLNCSFEVFESGVTSSLEHLDLVPCDDTGSELILCEVPARFSWNLFFPNEAE
jgi:hypothetical protein